ncbi:MAG: hypothetical protein KDD62_09845 [Bdellovibrionales bacterium]|nr:hypothetical protein [Bdellovibrionales bacterium]
MGSILDNNTLTMSPGERNKAAVLIIEPDANDRNNLRTSLKNLGFGTISDAPNHFAGLEKMEERSFSHVIFAAKETNMPVVEFVVKALEGRPDTIVIPSSSEPDVDDVFEMLIKGARGFLVKPFTIDTVDNAIVMASKGDPISDAVLQAKNRNEALVAVLLQSLDKVATVMRQSRQFETAKREVPKAMAIFQRSSELAKTFCKDGEVGFFMALEEFCIERSKGPASRLGRLRKRLKTSRKTEDESSASA